MRCSRRVGMLCTRMYVCARGWMRGVAAVRDMCRGIKVREAINATKTVREICDDENERRAREKRDV